MLKNRDTPSNPYRVPPQPTPGWVKISITSLFVSTLALMGVVVYLMVMQQQCGCAIPDVNADTSSSNRKMAPLGRPDMASDDGDGNGREGEVVRQQDDVVRQQENIRLLVKRMDGLQDAVSRIQYTVDDLEGQFRMTMSRDQDLPTGSSTSQNLSPSDMTLIQKVPGLESSVNGLETKLARHISAVQQDCKQGDYKYGVHCYDIGEAKMTQIDAKNWCVSDHGAQSSLVIVKDKFEQDFIAAKLPNRLHSFWIGIERERRAPALTSHVSSTSTPQVAPSSYRSAHFEYIDGTRVQKNVWQMWRPGVSTAGSDRNSANKDCASMTYDTVTSQWRWDERVCTERMGYICQYFIMTS